MSVTIPFTQEQLETLAENYKSGWTLEKISQRYGISQSAVSRRLKSMGVEIRAQGRGWTITNDMMDRAIELRSKGTLWKDVEQAIGVAGTSLSMAIRRRRRGLEASPHD